jgi:hypothetical protein
MIPADITTLKVGDLVGYTTITGDLQVAQVSHIYDGDKHGDCQIFIPVLRQHCDYPINELMVGDRA